MYSFGKRLIDFIVAALLIFSLMPILLIVALLVRFKLGAPVLFCQLRPGKDGKPFKIYKFRTMLDEVALDGTPLSDEKRLTSFGYSLRASSVDELPELFNVLKGDMSLIGPRPLLMKYLHLYNEFQARRHEVRPGITGWAQVNGFRGETKEPELMKKRMDFDLWYLNNWTFFLDIKIILKTFIIIFKHKGV